jgi:hypothetical protein
VKIKRAYARTTDPETSWEATDAVSESIRESQLQVLAHYRRHGPGAHWELLAKVDWPISPSGFRTRVSELVREDLIYFTGDYVNSPGSPRRCRVWAAR